MPALMVLNALMRAAVEWNVMDHPTVGGQPGTPDSRPSRNRGGAGKAWGKAPSLLTKMVEAPGWLCVVPAIVAMVGMLPYVELRTASTYNMYSNLRMVQGRSNHLVVRASLPLFERQRGLVSVIWSTDPDLDTYSRTGYDLPWDSFRGYLAAHPAVRGRFERLGQQFDVDPNNSPFREAPPPPWLQKLFPLRAVDRLDTARCQDVFLPAL